MTIEAKVIAHSRADGAPDLITLQVKYPRFVHAEMMTHRVFSRNAASSRAIPIERMIRDVETDPAMPVAWGRNKPGMQAGAEVDVITYGRARAVWDSACEDAVMRAKRMNELGLHKQIVNRLLEPFAHITVVITATDWDNFFDLRCHPDADPTMRAVAEAMRDAIAGSKAIRWQIKNKDGIDQNWHLPYISHASDFEFAWAQPDDPWATLAMISAARCARVSYLNHDGTSPDIEKDLALAKRLLDSKHMSPFEHQARAPERCANGDADAPHLFGNLDQWVQHRKMIEWDRTQRALSMIPMGAVQ